jgi:hypothetical protein
VGRRGNFDAHTAGAIAGVAIALRNNADERSILGFPLSALARRQIEEGHTARHKRQAGVHVGDSEWRVSARSGSDEQKHFWRLARFSKRLDSLFDIFFDIGSCGRQKGKSHLVMIVKTGDFLNVKGTARS